MRKGVPFLGTSCVFSKARAQAVLSDYSCFCLQRESKSFVLCLYSVRIQNDTTLKNFYKTSILQTHRLKEISKLNSHIVIQSRKTCLIYKEEKRYKYFRSVILSFSPFTLSVNSHIWYCLK